MPHQKSPSAHEAKLKAHLPHHPAKAFAIMEKVRCVASRRLMAPVIAQCWSRQDINTAWNTVAQSSLPADEKQRMLNDLWS